MSINNGSPWRGILMFKSDYMAQTSIIKNLENTLTTGASKSFLPFFHSTSVEILSPQTYSSQYLIFLLLTVIRWSSLRNLLERSDSNPLGRWINLVCREKARDKILQTWMPIVSALKLVSVKSNADLTGPFVGKFGPVVMMRKLVPRFKLCSSNEIWLGYRFDA